MTRLAPVLFVFALLLIAVMLAAQAFGPEPPAAPAEDAPRRTADSARSADSARAARAAAARRAEPRAARNDSLATLTAMQDSGRVAMPAAEREALLREDSLWAEALRIHYNALVVDGHIDTPTLMLDEGYAVAQRHTAYRANVDLPRMQEGGLDAAFFSIYVNASYGEGAAATGRARRVIAEVKRQLSGTDAAALATSADDVRRLARSGQRAVLLGLEGGHALAASPDTLAALADAGIRYVTLTHVNTNAWADASQSRPQHGGLTDLGRAMVRAMNRLGVLVDLSHVSDSTFYDALAATEAPPILSHTSARALSPSVRNASDAMLRALAERGGVVMINFFDAMVNPRLDAGVMQAVRQQMAADGASLRQLWRYVYDEKRRRGLPGATLEDVLNHIDHAVRVAGIDHVALGSDFDGVFDLPDGLGDVTRLPWITHGLLRRGYSEADLYKILGGNTLRVLEAAERLR